MRFQALFLLLAAGALLLSGLPSAKYTENLTVQVFDQSYRPVEGASVYVEYELSSVRGNIKTKPKLSDSSGTANILFTNYEEIQNLTKYSFTVFVKYGSQLVTASLVADDMRNMTHVMENRTYSMQVESYVAFVRVMDQSGKPLAANVTIGDATRPTSASGSTFFTLPPGNYTIMVEREGLVKNVPAGVDSSTGDRSFDVVLRYYNLDVHVQDDRRQPLLASVEVGGVARQTDDKGMAHFENITTDAPEVLVTYGQGIKRAIPSLASGQSLDVVFDLGKPAIKEQYSSLSASGVGTVRFFVEDPGPESSGVDTVSVAYEVAGAQNRLSVYAIGYNSFEAKIPAQPPGTLVKYSIAVSDKEGNSVSEAGSYVVPSAQQQNATGPSQPAQAGQPLPNEGIFVGIAVLAILAFAAFYYFNRKKEERTIRPPELPPQLPQQ